MSDPTPPPDLPDDELLDQELDPDGVSDAPSPDPVDPLVLLALRLPQAADEAAALSRLDLSRLVALTASAAREEPDAAWLERLASLRKTTLLANHKDALALVLAATGDVAAALGSATDPVLAHIRVDALDALVGVRAMQDKPGGCHDAMLLLAGAQAEAGEPAAAEATLMRALTHARGMAPGGHVKEAGARMSRTLVHLGELLVAQGRGDEGRSWLEGAIDMATDDEGRAAAQAALAFART
ncbi:MAG: hypothetical protein H6742_11815 [Alphaproteobacteria bacterium]|nr:hypothetical protein [Alphaproteobacteria bacterium]